MTADHSAGPIISADDEPRECDQLDSAIGSVAAPTAAQNQDEDIPLVLRRSALGKEFHPLALLFPSITEAEFKVLVERVSEHCLGHLLCSGKAGWEASATDEKSRGVYSTRAEAAAAISKHEQHAAGAEI